MTSSKNTMPVETARDRARGVGPLPVVLITAAMVVLGLLLLARLGVCTWSPLCSPLLADDVAQGRLDTALPAPQGVLLIEQSFVAVSYTHLTLPTNREV